MYVPKDRLQNYLNFCLQNTQSFKGFRKQFRSSYFVTIPKLNKISDIGGKMKYRYHLLLIIACCTLFSHAYALDTPELLKGQTVYIPAYSHIYIGNKGTPYLLAVTLSIRNIDPDNSIQITLVDYFESQGKRLKHFISEPVDIAPLASTRYLISQKDKTGGSGANFIVKWKSNKKCNPPVIETIMIGTQSQQGISFTSRGVPILPSK